MVCGVKLWSLMKSNSAHFKLCDLKDIYHMYNYCESDVIIITKFHKPKCNIYNLRAAKRSPYPLSICTVLFSELSLIEMCNMKIPCNLCSKHLVEFKTVNNCVDNYVCC